MGTIFAGTGLVSGIDIQSLVDQLIVASSRPRDLLVKRIGNLDAQKSALLDISARVTAMLTRAAELKRTSSFQAVSATSSNTAALNATASAGALPGTYSFVVQSLATRHQAISRGFASLDAPLAAGTLTIESSAARVNNRTRLEELNGFAGVQRGAFKITDASGKSASIDVRDAVTLSDVIDKINGAGLNVAAEVRGDHVRLRETTGGELRIAEIDGGRTAADLGFGSGATYAADGLIDGRDLLYLSSGTPLSRLNDGLGIRTADAGGDFTISGDAFPAFTVDLSGLMTQTTAIGQLNHGAGAALGRIRVTTTDAAGVERQTEVDLTGVSTVGQAASAISSAVSGVNVTVAGNPGRLVVSYADGATDRKIKIEDIDSTTAANLGISGEASNGKIDGRQILFMDTTQDVLSAIQHAVGNDGRVLAEIDGAGLRLRSADGGAFTLAAVSGSDALADLGLSEGTFAGTASSARLLGGIDSVLLNSLNGGAGVEAGRIQIQAGAGAITVDLTGAQTLSEVIERIRDAASAGGLAIEAGVDGSGSRLELRSLDGVTGLSVSDLDGRFAEQTGLTGSGAVLRSENLQRQYVSETTLLSQLGGGFAGGKIKVTNSLGVYESIDLSASTVKTVGDVIDEINARESELHVRARINDTGDGILLEDAAGGTLSLKVQDETGAAARDLKLLGEHAGGTVNGSFEEKYELTGAESLQALLTKINAGSRLATGSTLNDGATVQPYRLQLSSARTGLAGELVLDGGATGLDFTTLAKAQDARVLLGGASGGVLATSSTNTISGLIPGVTLDLTGTSAAPVEVTVAQDTGKLIETMKGLVSAFNSALQRIDELSSFNSETQARGILLGDGTLLSVENRLMRFTSIRATGELTGAASAGLKLKNGRLEFDEQKFRDALAQSPQGVTELFTDPEDGLAVWLETQAKAITESTGLIGRRAESLGDQRDLLDDRVTQMNTLLDLKRERLTRQFLAMEQSLAQLQSQQGALTQLSALAAARPTR